MKNKYQANFPFYLDDGMDLDFGKAFKERTRQLLYFFRGNNGYTYDNSCGMHTGSSQPGKRIYQ